MSNITYFIAGCLVGSLCTFFGTCIGLINSDYEDDESESKK